MDSEKTPTSAPVDAVVMLRVAELVRWLTNYREQPWTRVASFEDAATRVLSKMVALGLIEGRHHPHIWSNHPTVYRVVRELFGRLDGVDHSLFDEA